MPVENNRNSPKVPKPSQVGESFLIFLAALLLFNLAIIPNLGTRYPEVAYSDFIDQVEAGKVDRAIIGAERIFSMYSNPIIPLNLLEYL
jgi:cell division protease FtsH